MAWTPAQEKAITTKDKNLLISAAAGSGKTAVLIERIIRLLKDTDSKVDISRLLIVTFTRAAAAELRQKISRALSSEIAKNPASADRLFDQLTALGSAHISTIDSFYADIVKKYAATINIPASLRIADDSELVPIRRRIMNEVLDMGYRGEFNITPDHKDPSQFIGFADLISDMRNDSRAWETLISLRAKLLSHPRSINYLKDCEDDYASAVSMELFSTPHGKVLKSHLTDSFKVMLEFLNEACDTFENDDLLKEKYLIGFKYDRDFCKEFLDILETGSYAAAREKIHTYENIKLGSLKAEQKTEESITFASFRSEFVVDIIKEHRKKYFSGGCSETELLKYTARLAILCNVMHAILSKFEELYTEEKLTKGICEFNDIKQWAYELLVKEDGSPTDIALEVAEGFDAVYIDEYQDVDPVQDRIFRAISANGERFMVGDVKQSIYGFRGADPSLFMKYRNEFAHVDVEADTLPDEKDCTIFMSSNFRCDENVIRFANSVCAFLFSVANGGITYTPEDDLEFAKNKTDGYTSPEPPIPATVVLIEPESKSNNGNYGGDDEEEDSASNSEAKYIACEIARLIKEEKKNDGKKLEPGDIAVFARAEKFLGRVATELDKLGIRYSSESGKSIFDDPEVMLALSLLHATDNPRKDIHMAGVLMSPLFGFSADELILLRRKDKKCCLYEAICNYAAENSDLVAEKCNRVIQDLDELRIASVSLSADKIVRLVFSKYSLLSRNEEGGNSRDALLKLYENARKYEGDDFKGLYNYLLYVDDMIESENAPSTAGTSENSVKLMTIHKSKGLEFPVCFVGSAGSRFNRDDTRKPLLYTPTLGVSADILDEEGFGKIKTPYQSALAIRMTDVGTEEEMRLLYVALTRARERLYVTAMTTKSLGLKVEYYSRYASRGTVMKGNNYIGWILTALQYLGKGDFYKIENIKEEDIINSFTTEDEKKALSAPRIEYDEETAALVKRNFEFEYPYLHISNLPAKMSVSKLSPGVLDRSTESEEDSSTTEKFDKSSMPSLKLSPSFMSDTDEDTRFTAAEKGTATHAFLQFCDFDNVKKNGVGNELDRLIADRFLDERWKNAVNLDRLEKFFKSKLFEDISGASRIWREQRFNILLPAAPYTNDENYGKLIKDEKLLVQGVIDIFFEDRNGDLILCDYKTDYLTKEEINDPALARKKLNEAHAEQLSYYAEALRSMFGKYPARVLIYSLPLGNTVEIDTFAILN